MWVGLPQGHSGVRVYLEALEQGVAVSPGPMHDIDAQYQNCFRMSYAHAPPQQLEQAVSTVAGIVRPMLSRGPQLSGVRSLM